MHSSSSKFCHLCLFKHINNKLPGGKQISFKATVGYSAINISVMSVCLVIAFVKIGDLLKIEIVIKSDI